MPPARTDLPTRRGKGGAPPLPRTRWQRTMPGTTGELRGSAPRGALREECGTRTVVILALDVGEVRIGVATSDPSATLASPRGVIQRRSNAQAVAAVAREVAAVGAALVVVGLPLSLDGVPREQAHRVQRFGDRLRSQLAVPVVYQDERLSTVTATEALRAAGVRPERIKERVDAAAAAVILRDYLDQHPADTTPVNPSGWPG